MNRDHKVLIKKRDHKSIVLDPFNYKLAEENYMTLYLVTEFCQRFFCLDNKRLLEGCLSISLLFISVSRK